MEHCWGTHHLVGTRGFLGHGTSSGKTRTVQDKLGCLLSKPQGSQVREMISKVVLLSVEMVLECTANVLRAEVGVGDVLGFCNTSKEKMKSDHKELTQGLWKKVQLPQSSPQPPPPHHPKPPTATHPVPALS